ncbi:MAG: hypothetical protein H8E68_03920 [Kiritimatiellaeota bacterium]|nr:hypothetical protein [Kiritimatiellota bacterium]
MRVDIMQMWNCFRRRKKTASIFLVLTVVFFSGSVFSEMRIWEEISGVQVKAEFERELFDSVQLRRPDGSLYSVPLENLSAQDIKYIRTMIPPKIELSVRTKKRSKERSKNITRADYEQFQDDINVATASVEVEKKSRTDYDGNLRLEIYLVGREVFTPDIYRLSGKRASQVKFTEENKGIYTFEASADFRVYMEYNYDLRGANYEGHLVVVVDPKGNKLASDTNISWLKDEANVEALRQFRVDQFFDESCTKRSAPRPRYYNSRREF